MATDLIVSFLSSVPAAVASKFKKPPLFVAVPAAPMGQGLSFYRSYLAAHTDGRGNVVPGLFKQAGGSGSIGRVAVIGFSNGVDSGVSQLLGANDAKKIDFIGAFDGIHGGFLVDPKPSVGFLGQLNMSRYGKWIAAAQRAAAQKPSENPKAPVMVITHSSIEPSFPSTTETANAIWQEALATAPADYEATYWSELDGIVYPGGMQIKSTLASDPPTWTWSGFDDGWYDRRICNGLSIFGWGDPGVSPQKRIQAICRDRYNGTADHLFQARAVLPAILETYLVGRWNPVCGPVSGLGQASGCTGGDGGSYDEGEEGPLTAPLPAPLPIPVPKAPVSCPYPKPGYYIVGSKSDPCAQVPEGVPPKPPAPSPASFGAGHVVAGLAGAAVGFAGARWAMKRWGRSARL